MDAALETTLIKGAQALGVTLDPGAVKRLGQYLDLLLLWNRRINLTAIREPEAIVTKHLIDSLAVVPQVPDGARVVDVGSGGGFPGAVLAAVRGGVEVTMVEPSHKKAAFLQTLVRELPLPRARVESLRIEEFRDSSAFTPFDVAVSRATWDLPDWLEVGRTLVKPDGLVLGMEGADRHDLPPGAVRINVSVPGASRALVLMRLG